MKTYRRSGLAVLCLVISASAGVAAFRSAVVGSGRPVGRALSVADQHAPAPAPTPWKATVLCPLEDCSIPPDAPSTAVTRYVLPLGSSAASPARSTPAADAGALVRPQDRVRWRCDADGGCRGTISREPAAWECGAVGRCEGDVRGAARWTCDHGRCRGTILGAPARWRCGDDGSCIGTISGQRSKWACDDDRCEGSIGGIESAWRCENPAVRCHGRGSPAIMALHLPDDR